MNNDLIKENTVIIFRLYICNWHNLYYVNILAPRNETTADPEHSL